MLDSMPMSDIYMPMSDAVREMRGVYEAMKSMGIYLLPFYMLYAMILYVLLAILVLSSFGSLISTFFVLNNEMVWIIILLDVLEIILGTLCRYYDGFGIFSSTTPEHPCTFLSRIFYLLYLLFSCATKSYILFTPISAGLYDTYFYYWYVSYFKLQIAFLLNVYIIAIQVGVLLFCSFSCILMQCGKFGYTLLLLLLGPPITIIGMYVSYLEIFKFDWKQFVNHYLVSKSSDLQEEASNPGDSPSSTYYFSLVLLIIYIVLLCNIIRTIVTKLFDKKKQVKQVEIVHTALYYQAIPLNISDTTNDSV